MAKITENPKFEIELTMKFDAEEVAFLDYVSSCDSAKLISAWESLYGFSGVKPGFIKFLSSLQQIRSVSSRLQASLKVFNGTHKAEPKPRALS